jgi:hypothetical protein
VRARFSAVAVLSLAVSGSAFAQLPNFPQFDLDHLEVNSSAMRSLVVGTGEILPVGAVRFSLAGDYANNPYQYIDPTGAVSSIISDRYTVHVVGGFAPMDWLEIGLDVPVVASQNPGEGIEVALPGLGVVQRALGSPLQVARLEPLARGDHPVAGFEILRRDTVEHGRPVVVARHHVPGAAQLRSGGLHVEDLALDRGGIILGQRIARARAHAHAARGHRARQQHDQVGAERLDLLLHPRLRAGPDGDHGDDRGHADNDP